MTARVAAWLDRAQRRSPALAFAYAVHRKYHDDEGGRDAALITYYGFLSVFPLLLLGVAVLSQVLVRNADLRERLVTAMVPPTLRSTVDASLAALPTSTIPLVVGLIGLLLSATRVVYSVDRTLNHIAAVPRRERVGAVRRFLRAVVMVLVLLAGVVTVGCLTVAVAALPGMQLTGRVVGALGSTVVTFLVLLVCGKALLDRPVSVRVLCLPAVLGAAVVTAVLQVGTRLLAVVTTDTGPVYGGFTTVAGIFALLSLISQGLVYAAEIAAVHHARLWPRALDRNHPTEADLRALHLLRRMHGTTSALRTMPPRDTAHRPADRTGERRADRI